jgi:uroporphyrinogen decarboxylase
MSLSVRENYLRNVTFSGPQWIPCTVVISGATWDQYREEVEDILVKYPLFFPGFEKGKRDFANWDYGPACRKGEDFTDAWGCVWRSEFDGIEGVVIEHPLADWDSLAGYKVPNPLETADRGPANWSEHEQRIRQQKLQSELTQGYLPHGFFFMRLQYLRGFENLMYDLALEEPHLHQLVDMVTTHNETLVTKWLSMGVDVMEFAEDLGAQNASLISPKMFRKWVTPVYKRLMQPCHDAGCYIAFHSDGYIMELIDEFIECGVHIINPQDLCNGIDNLAKEVKGRMCIRLDIDRQTIVPYGSRKDIFDLIEEEVRKLGSPEGGLEFIVGIYPPTPPENIDALLAALQKFRTYWWD